MFYIICNILYYIGIVVAGIAIIGIIARGMNIIENEYDKKQNMKTHGVIINWFFLLFIFVLLLREIRGFTSLLFSSWNFYTVLYELIAHINFKYRRKKRSIWY